VPNSTYIGGTLSIQRRFTNNTGRTITRLSYRVVDITTLNSPGAGLGAALNSSGMLTLPGGSLAPGASVAVQFLLGVVQGGTFRYLVNIKALPGAPSLAAPSAVTRAAKMAAKR
jgi:hypothetical protein